MLRQSLAGQPGLQLHTAPIPAPPLPQPLLGFAHRLGFDLPAFHQNYPLRWPAAARDLVHLTRLGQATLLLRKGRRRVVVSVHDIIHYMYRHDPAMHIYRHPVQAWFDTLAVRLLKRADLILASSHYTRQSLIEHAAVPADKIQVIYLGIDRQRFAPQAVPAAFYQRYQLDPNTPYVLHISTEEPRKNVPALLRAFAALHDQMPKVVLLKIGRPLYPAERQRHLELVEQLKLGDSVRFIDHVPDEDLPLFYNAARALVLPSLEEGFGFPVLEAMACGTPVVCSRRASLPELGGQAAAYIDLSDQDTITAAMLSVLEDPHLRSEMRAEGLLQAKKFQWPHTASETLAVYQTLDMKNLQISASGSRKV